MKYKAVTGLLLDTLTCPFPKTGRVIEVRLYMSKVFVFAHFRNSFVGTVYIWRYILGHDISAPCLSHASEQFIKKHSPIFLPSTASLLCKDEIGSSWTVLRGPKLSVLWWLKTWSICRWAWSSTSTWTSAKKQTTRERNIDENAKVLDTGRVFDDSINQFQSFKRNFNVTCSYNFVLPTMAGSFGRVV